MTKSAVSPGIKILIVDDEPDILEIVGFNLIKNGYEIQTASDGMDALAKVPVFKPDLILLDIMMPKMDGVEVCRILREKSTNDKIKIVFLTARSEDFTQIAALDLGGDDFITKPVKPAVLVSRIKAVLRRSEANINPTDQHFLEVGDIIIDKEKFIVKKNGIPIDLAKKEFQLVQLMASKPGKVFTRDEIFRKVWGNDVIVGNRTIDVHIRKVREKLGEEIIKTIKGIGYKFDN